MIVFTIGFSSTPLLSLVDADMENSILGNLERMFLTIVVFPEPEGAENIMALPLCMYQADFAILVLIVSASPSGTSLLAIFNCTSFFIS